MYWLSACVMPPPSFPDPLLLTLAFVAKGQSSDMAPNMDPSRMATKLMSWNVRAINNPAKRSKVFSHLRDHGVEIVYLQETHLLDRDHLKLCRGIFIRFITQISIVRVGEWPSSYTGMYNL